MSHSGITLCLDWSMHMYSSFTFWCFFFLQKVVQEYQHQQQQEIDQQRDKEAAEVMLMLDSGLPTEERDSKLSDPYDSGDADMPHEDTEILSQDLRLPSSLKPKSSTREIGTQKSFKSYYYRSSGIIFYRN